MSPSQRQVTNAPFALSLLALATLGACVGSVGDPSSGDPSAGGPSETTAQQDALYGEPAALPAFGTVVARGIPGAGAVTPVGTFHPGNPLHDKPALAAASAPGMVLDPTRLLVASTSNFGAPLARPTEAPGAVLSLDVSGAVIDVPADFGTAGGQASALAGRVILFSAQSPAFLNSVNSPTAVTAALPAASLPLGISLNRGFGRPWFANTPAGANADGTISVEDPAGAPLAGAPDPVAGGVFAGNQTNRGPASTKGLDHGAVATALLTKSPDGTGKAVFLAAEADGSIVQVHVTKGVDALAPAGTFAPLTTLTTDAASSSDPNVVTRVGLLFNWVPSRIAYVSDPLNDRIVALDLGDDGTLFTASAPRFITSRSFHRPIDLAPAVPEIASHNFASNTTLGGGSDLYVLCRGNGTIVRVTQAGQVVALRRVVAQGMPPFAVSGISVSEDARSIWVTAVARGGEGFLMRVPAFGEGFVTPQLLASARGDMFGNQLSPFQGLGPLFNARSCNDCHGNPAPGGMGTADGSFVTREGRLAADGSFDPLVGHGGPVARTHSISELGFFCFLRPGVSPLATITSKRSAMSLRGTALIDFIAERDVLTAQAAEPADVRGRVNRTADGRLGRFGWKGQTATLVEFMGSAFRDEMGVTNPLALTDEQNGCFGSLLTPEIDAVPLQDVASFLNTVDPPMPTPTCLASAGATAFTTAGCASCHTASFAGPNRTINLYSDLLVHDMGPALDDRVVMGGAAGNEWRTMPLWKLSERSHFLHDGRATTVSAAIAAHGGQAAASAAAFAAMDTTTQQSLLDFLGCI